MAKNRHICGRSVVFVPYRECHVVKYHQWMKEPALQYLTGSEPLTLAEEFSMMSSWTSDVNKCTFIILDKELYQSSSASSDDEKQVESMIGDINIYIDTNESTVLSAELEIMVAEECHRGCGKGKEAVRLMMRFANEVIGVQKFVVKIKYSNEGSHAMFTRFGFREVSRSDVFEEITYELVADQQWVDGIRSDTNYIQYVLL
ncbi:unnamed protein product [Medioppia subpectinata]|uniref:N-acetyltransferase domain-containing protein n=1 Tax=Medioppia subpectinata TaxID=1979941 RepID=A0A7R9KPM5_9ACAR|nr:unnamed protein product [Medioppia subpectinata]CAG2107169.1 unnamed protein product [Medioppia subpectinata]